MDTLARFRGKRNAFALRSPRCEPDYTPRANRATHLARNALRTSTEKRNGFV